ncbi:hypothetical protein L915_02276 [Phytophthora nicotianae]|uniref:Uncharacterized protein n=1 Tax=Phytophthora nicotianae TaxID=4792 RepID=W2HHG5_PHYNI|nr:hypothetical protein L915_02276 [Phytophthora nicotianae]
MTASSVCTLTSEAVNNGEVWFYIAQYGKLRVRFRFYVSELQ